jgi:hypothetical protein
MSQSQWSAFWTPNSRHPDHYGNGLELLPRFSPSEEFTTRSDNKLASKKLELEYAQQQSFIPQPETRRRRKEELVAAKRHH